MLWIELLLILSRELNRNCGIMAMCALGCRVGVLGVRIEWNGYEMVREKGL